MKKTVYNACDLLATESVHNALKGKCLGLVTNLRTMTKESCPVFYSLKNAYNIKALFAPEHGFDGLKQAGGKDVSGIKEKNTELLIYNLFQENISSDIFEDVFSRIDALVFDIQDIGVRYYTYQYVLLDAMRLCKRFNKEIIVLDRINLLGGLKTDGNYLEESCVSEVGAVVGQPVLSGMTIGELGLWFNKVLSLNTDITVIPCQGWERNFAIEDTDLTFFDPSPNMTSLKTLRLYPAMCLFEGTNLSEGRGTDKPFEIFGAPWIEPQRVINAFESSTGDEKELFKSIYFEVCSFIPSFSDYAGEKCYGLKLHLKEKSDIGTYALGLTIIKILRTLYPDKIIFNEHLTKLAGTKEVLNYDFEPVKYLGTQKEKAEKFKKSRESCLIY